MPPTPIAYPRSPLLPLPPQVKSVSGFAPVASSPYIPGK